MYLGQTFITPLFENQESNSDNLKNIFIDIIY